MSFAGTCASFFKELMIFKPPTEKIFLKIRWLIQIIETGVTGVIIRITTRILISLGRRGNGLIERSLARTTKFSEYIPQIHQLNLSKGFAASKEINSFFFFNLDIVVNACLDVTNRQVQ